MHHDHAHPTIPAKPMSRRSMLKALAASSVAVSIGGAAFGASAAAAAPGPKPNPNAAAGKGPRLIPKNRIGIQLYTVRDKVSSLGFRAVFEELADIGFTDVEFAGYTQGGVGPITIAEIRQLLDDNGLRATGSHVNLNPGNIDQQLDIAHQLGSSFLGQGGQITNSNTVSGWTSAAQTWNEMGAKASASGIRLYAHNHAGEFGFTSDDPSRRVYDLLWDEFDPQHVGFELDVYWAHVGQHRFPGFKPIDYVLRDPDRFPLLHLKDGKLNAQSGNGYDIIEFGAGDIDYQSFLKPLKNRSQRWWGMYEQDNASSSAVPPNPLNSLGNADRSYAAIEGLRGGDSSGR